MSQPSMRVLFLILSALVIVVLTSCQEPSTGEPTQVVPPAAQVQVPEEATAPEPPATQSRAGASADPADDGIADAPEAYAVGMAGPYILWEDTEGGTVCELDLHDSPILGGYALKVDDACVERLGLVGQMYAWFVDPRDESLVITDAARQPIVRLPHLKGLEYYLPRDATRAHGLNLEPRQK